MHLMAMVVIVALTALMQASLVMAIPSLEMRPDLVLVVVVAWSMLRGFEEGAALGATAGFFIDLTSGAPFGLYTVIMATLGAVAAVGDAQSVRGNPSLLLATAVLATVAFHGALMLGLQALGWQALPAARFLRLLFPTIVLNLMLLPVAFLVAERVFRMTTGWRQLEL